MTPFSKNDLPEKVILSGADCFHLVLDKHAKKHGAGGNVMRKAFYFSSSVSFEKIENILRSSPVIYWLCNIKLMEPPLFQLPYWRYKDRGNEIVVKKHDCDVENEIPKNILTRDITVDADRFIEADIIYYPSGSSAFVLSWNHILLDAKGTTLLFEHLNHLSENKPQNFDIFFPAREKKTNIFTYISNMYKVKRFVQTSAKPPVSSVATAKARHGEDETMNRTIAFNAEETARVASNSFKAGSRFGATLYFIACCSQIIHLLNKQKNKAGDLWLPVPYDGRLKGAVGPLISNCVSFLFYRIPEAELDSVPQTVKCLSAQMKSQIGDGIPQRYTMFLNMMRHIPLWLYYLLVSRTGKGVFASFLYTSTGDNFNELTHLFGEPLRDLNMIPALTFPPGLTFVFLKHDNKLNINIAYSPDVITDNDLHLIEEKIKQALLAEY
ncbi:MAG: hypothetical protein JNM14_05015 [Ferruginibacter sp.]|nr:hypothetical protein [Ferruginibacter sp.]